MMAFKLPQSLELHRYQTRNYECSFIRIYGPQPPTLGSATATATTTGDEEMTGSRLSTEKRPGIVQEREEMLRS